MKDLSPSLYDIAIASLVSGAQQSALIDWLVAHQNLDGSWGAALELSGYDNYICTYAAAVALRNVDHPLADAAFQLLLDRDLWNVEKIPETLTFGGLIEVLDRFCTYRQWEPIPHHPFIRSIISHEQVKWDRMVSWPRFFDPTISISGYCAERVFGDDRIDLDRFIEAFQVRNGSIANSPAASALTLLELERRGCTPPANLRQYIQGLQPRTTSYLDYVPHFVTSWALMFYSELGPTHHLPQADVEALHAALYDKQGRPQLLCTVGDTTIPGDTDSTACAILAAIYTGHRPHSIDFLDFMFNDTHYQTFVLERDASLSTNIHTAALLLEYGKLDRLSIVLDWLTHLIMEKGENTCKWHASPVYTMGEAARLMSRMPYPQASHLAHYAADYLLDCQNVDGGWGITGSTVEETGYALLGLSSVAQYLREDSAVLNALTDGANYLSGCPTNYEPLWIGKSLYCVEPLVPVIKTVSAARVLQVQSSVRLQ